MPFFLPPKLPEESLSPRVKFDYAEEEEAERRKRLKGNRRVKHQREFFTEDTVPVTDAEEEEEEEEGQEREEEVEEDLTMEMTSYRLAAKKKT